MRTTEDLGSISKLLRNAVLFCAACLALAVPGRAGTLINVSATASTAAPGATNVTYTLTYTTATAVTQFDALLFAIFPTGATLPYLSTCTSVVAVSINGSPQNLATLLGGACTLGPNIIVLGLANGQSVAAGSTVQITISGGTNGNPFATAMFSDFGTEEDSADPLPYLVGSVPTAAVSTPTLSQWALLALAMMFGGMGYWWLRRQKQDQV